MHSTEVNHWEVTTLGNCAQWYSGGTPDTTVAAYWNGSVPWITASSLHDFYLYDSERKVTSLGLENGTRLMPKDTIIFVVRGMSLKSEFRVGIARKPMAFGQDCKAIVAKEGIDPLFLANAIRAKASEILELVDEASHGTGRLQTEAIQGVEIPLPPLPEQRAIAAILGSLDDKIELNRQMNRTLEAMAQALFKSWFVDFDPVRAKAEGRETGLPEDVAALFPDRLVESELGEIPEGWDVQLTADVLERLSVGKKYEQKTVFDSGSVPVLDQGKSGVIGYHNDLPGVIASVDRPIAIFANHTCYMRLIHFPFSTIQNVLPFVGKGINTIWLYYATLGNQPFIEYKGHWPDFIIHKLTVPKRPLTQFFGDSVHPLLKKMWNCESESRTLAALRNTLLPKLISGEVRVRSVERFV